MFLSLKIGKPIQVSRYTVPYRLHANLKIKKDCGNSECQWKLLQVVKPGGRLGPWSCGSCGWKQGNGSKVSHAELDQKNNHRKDGEKTNG